MERVNKVTYDTIYICLRDEMLQNFQLQNYLVTTMYVVWVTIFAFSFERHQYWILLLSYVFLIPFQGFINRKRNASLKISKYLSVFIENENPLMWETAHGFLGYKSKRKYEGWNMLIDWLSRTNTFHLGILSSIIGTYSIMNQYYGTVFKIFYVFLAFFLAVVLFRLNYNLREEAEISHGYEDVMKKYKEKYSKECEKL